MKAVTSDGSKFENPRHLAKHQQNLKRKQQKLSRKQKGSNTRQKARRLVAKVQSKISRCRGDFLHKLSRKIVNENQVIAVENLLALPGAPYDGAGSLVNVKGMVRNAPPLSTADPAGFEIQQERGSAFHALNLIQGGKRLKTTN